jgi:hypothetical protein
MHWYRHVEFEDIHWWWCQLGDAHPFIIECNRIADTANPW